MKRIYTLNEDYFENIDNEYKAYMLGFIYADGNIQKDKNRLRITLKHDDIKILETFKDQLNYSGDIKVRELKSKTRDTKGYIIAELSIMSKKLIQDLNKHGVFPNKTFSINYPNIPKHLDKHFIRGFFDGDGSIYERKDRPNGYRAELVCASKEFLEKICLKMDIEFRYVKPKKNVYVISLYKDKAKPLLIKMYAQSNIHLERKYKLYQRFICPSI